MGQTQDTNPTPESHAARVIAYATPHASQSVDPTSSHVSRASLGLTGLGYGAVFLAANGGWLFYGQQSTVYFLMGAIPILFCLSFVLALIARGMKGPDLARSTLALFASGGSLLLVGAFLVYGILHLPNC